MRSRRTPNRRAERQHVLRMVMAEGGRLLAAGVLLGLAAAYWLTQLLRHQLFEGSPTEPRVLFGVSLILSIVALLASLHPAYRATRVNPMEALRHE